MKKQITITVILLIATAYATVFYFKNLSPPGMRTSLVMQAIPDNASLIFEFNNDKGFYDIYKGNPLFASIAGKQSLGELETLRRQLLNDPSIAKYFVSQNIFISVHPSKIAGTDLLLTLSSANGFELNQLEQLSRQPNSPFIATPWRKNAEQGYSIYIKSLKKRFYIINKENNIFAGSFSEDLITHSAAYRNKKDKSAWLLQSEQQNANSLANLYINYQQLSALFNSFLSNPNNDIFKNLRLFPALAELSLNYHTDALMFSGSTNIQHNQPASYLTLFAQQQGVTNHLTDIFPSTTAYSTNFAVSDPIKFQADLSAWQNTAGLKQQKNTLFDKIRAETGINIQHDFKNLLSNEFAAITTRYFEKFAVVSVKDGSKLKVLLTAISTMNDENTGQVNYEKLPFLLLGDAFTGFRKPYFTIVDNYLVLANSTKELTSFTDSYINRKFLGQSRLYNRFNELITAKSNISIYLNLKNITPVLQRDMLPSVFNQYINNEPGQKDFYGISIQFTAADRNFYTNTCLMLNADTTGVKN